MTIRNARILVTGGSGSFGTAFVKRCLDLGAARVLSYSRDEWKQAQLETEINDTRFRTIIGDVRDLRRLKLAARNCDYLIHAAALKRIEVCERDPFEAVQTNVIGTQHAIEAALDANIAKLVFLSTDKSVAALNVYGKTKGCAEGIVTAAMTYSEHGTRPLFAAVRYGNVAGSRGSIVPIFRGQVGTGQRLTVTDERMTRYWMRMGQAVQLVLYALATMRGGEVFIPKIPSFKVADLARAFGQPYEVVGARPGEKLHESLISRDEAYRAWDLGAYYVLADARPFGAQPVPDLVGGFAYSSDANTEWLGVNELKAELEAIECRA